MTLITNTNYMLAAIDLVPSLIRENKTDKPIRQLKGRL